MRTPPPSSVLEAFGAGSAPVPVPGGQGRSWRSGALVLKPLDSGADQLAWLAAELPRLDQSDVRIAPPLSAGDGRLVVGGWTAWPWLPGAPTTDWAAVIAAGDAFHRLTVRLGRPGFLDRRDDPWAVGDRAAEGTTSWRPRGAVPDDAYEMVSTLVRARRPVRGPSQLVHGDLTGNVLLAPGQPPAVIDVSPYWRPATWAACVVVVDAVTWRDADLRATVSLVADRDDAGQHLVRACLYRIVTDLEAAARRGGTCDTSQYRPVVEAALALA